MKKLRIGTEKGIIILFVVAAVICSAILFVAGMDSNNPSLWQHPYLWCIGIILVITPLSVFRWIEFSDNEICMYTCGIFRRRISADRIRSIQFIVQAGIPYLVICFDDHRPYDDYSLSNQLFFCSRKVYSIVVLEARCDEYINKLTELYGKVSLNDSFIKYRSKQKKNKTD